MQAPLPRTEPDEPSRESVGLKLLGDVYADANPNGDSRWEYVLRDESRRCFAGVLRPNLPRSALQRFWDLVRDGATWDQPKRPRTGELLPRKTDWMVADQCKCTYKYGGVEVDPTSGFPDWMLELMETCMPLCGLKRRSSWPNCCNLNLYEDGGMSVGWHADDEQLFQGKERDCPIVSFSLGQGRTFMLRRNGAGEDERPCKVELRDGDLMTMEGLTQKHYQHSVPKEKASGPRINLTWRWIRQHQARCPHGR